ncbi:MAG: DMT family transporter [Parabacteroides sp.]
MNSASGFVYGILTSMTFGLIPLFTLPLMAAGMHQESILFYRFLFASIALALMMVGKRESMRVKRDELPFLVLLGLLYTGSALFLFSGYSYMAAGIATTIHFTYPVFVTLILLLFFRERASFLTCLAIVLAIAGVARLSISDGNLELSGMGVIIVLLSAVCYGVYITIVNKSRIQWMTGRKLTFYVFAVSTLLFAVKLNLEEGIQPVPDGHAWLNLILLALVPTVVSNITLVLAVHRIGGTLTSVLGAVEPVTAVCVGSIVFSEPFTPQLALGIVMILTAVTLIILAKPIRQATHTTWRRLKREWVRYRSAT